MINGFYWIEINNPPLVFRCRYINFVCDSVFFCSLFRPLACVWVSVCDCDLMRCIVCGFISSTGFTRKTVAALSVSVSRLFQIFVISMHCSTKSHTHKPHHQNRTRLNMGKILCVFVFICDTIFSHPIFGTSSLSLPATEIAAATKQSSGYIDIVSENARDRIREKERDETKFDCAVQLTYAFQYSWYVNKCDGESKISVFIVEKMRYDNRIRKQCESISFPFSFTRSWLKPKNGRTRRRDKEWDNHGQISDKPLFVQLNWINVPVWFSESHTSFGLYVKMLCDRM